MIDTIFLGTKGSYVPGTEEPHEQSLSKFQLFQSCRQLLHGVPVGR